jgi:hypothetical protein
MTLKEFCPAMEKLNRPDWWAMAMTKQRLEHPEDPAWFVDTPSTVRVLSSPSLYEGFTDANMRFQANKYGLRLTLGGLYTPDHLRLGVAVQYAVEGKPFWWAYDEGAIVALRTFHRKAMRFGCQTIIQVDTPEVSLRNVDTEIPHPAPVINAKKKLCDWDEWRDWQELVARTWGESVLPDESFPNL